MGRILLTFDTEDFISENSIPCLHSLLSILKRNKSRALFFITGHMAEKLIDFPEVTALLEEHEIGYHSSSHSVHPALFEFTDVQKYKEAYDVALHRETSHVNPLTGQIEGKGGFLTLQSLFKRKKICAFRAPGFCWSPPHSEALRDLGLTFDFSANIGPSPRGFKGITFYPYPTLLDWQGTFSNYEDLLFSALRRKFTIIGLHPSLFINKTDWDAIYQQGNPRHIAGPVPKVNSESKLSLKNFEHLLQRTKRLEKLGLLTLGVELEKANSDLTITRSQAEEICEFSLRWPRRIFNYQPKYLPEHFLEFFQIS